MTRSPYRPYVGNLSFPLTLARLPRSGDIVQFLPRSLDLADEIWDGVSFLFLWDPAFTSDIEDFRLTLHLFHSLSCTHTALSLMDTVHVTLQPSFECKSAINNATTHETPVATVSWTFCSNNCAPSSSIPSASGPAQSLMISHGTLASMAHFCAVLR